MMSLTLTTPEPFGYFKKSIFARNFNEKFNFLSIKTLTDKTAKKNWEKYGNPDGPSSVIQYYAVLVSSSRVFSRDYSPWALVVDVLLLGAIICAIVALLRHVGLPDWPRNPPARPASSAEDDDEDSTENEAEHDGGLNQFSNFRSALAEFQSRTYFVDDGTIQGKLTNFHQISLRHSVSEPFRIVVNRQRLLEDSCRQIMALAEDELRGQLFVTFTGEDAVDFGGVAK